MINEQKAPQIRVTGFTDDWEQRKLGELLEVSNDRNNEGKYSQDNVLAASLGTELEEKHIFFGLRSTEESVKNYRIVKPGDVIYTKSPIKGYPNGIVRTSKGKGGIVPSLYCVYHSVNSINPSFIQSYLEDKGRLDAYLYPLVNIGARNNVNITDAGFLEGSIMIPKDIEEQTKIVNLLDKVTELITFHQRKCTTLCKLKQSMLQKMFPKEGEKVPEIRFAGFTDAWEQRKLGDKMYIKSRIGWQALTKDEYLDTGDYYLITGTDIDEITHTVDLSRCYYVSKERYDMDDKIQIHEGDIIITKDGTIGKVAMVSGLDKPATLNSHLFVLRDLSGTLNNRFLLQVLNSHIFDSFVESTKTGSTLTGLPQKTFVEFKFYAPRYEEQKKISGYLDNLDHLITLHQRKLETAKKLKKAMLQKMFP